MKQVECQHPTSLEVGVASVVVTAATSTTTNHTRRKITLEKGLQAVHVCHLVKESMWPHELLPEIHLQNKGKKTPQKTNPLDALSLSVPQVGPDYTCFSIMPHQRNSWVQPCGWICDTY